MNSGANPIQTTASPGVSFIVTALNEQQHIESTVRTIKEAVAGLLDTCEIVLVNDGSTDATGSLMDAMAANDPAIRVVHNPRNLGLGGAYKQGLQRASMEYVMWVSGDNAETSANLRNILSAVGQADIVIPYLRHDSNRPWFRRFTSGLFVNMVNLLFGLRIRYYNGCVVHRRALVSGIPIITNSFAYQAEALIRLLRKGASYVEIEYGSATYSGMISYALKPRNLVAVLGAIWGLFLELRFGVKRSAAAT